MRLHKDSIDRWFDNDFHLETRTLFISDQEDGAGVGPQMAEKVIKGIHLLVAHDKEKPIRILMNSMGGTWTDGMAIYDAIASCPCQVTIEAFGSCMSMATVLLQAADDRVLHSNTTFMIHNGSDGFEGDSKNFERWGEHSKKLRHRMYEIYAEASEKRVSFWEKKCHTDFIISAQEAVELGLADRVVGEGEPHE